MDWNACERLKLDAVAVAGCAPQGFIFALGRYGFLFCSVPVDCVD